MFSRDKTWRGREQSLHLLLARMQHLNVLALGLFTDLTVVLRERVVLERPLLSALSLSVTDCFVFFSAEKLNEGNLPFSLKIKQN